MRVCVTTEQRFERTSDGAVWTTGAMPCSFWRRYLRVFDEVRVIARIRQASGVGASWTRADGEQVHFVEIPYYVGLAEYLPKAAAVRRAARNSVDANDALILRVSSTLAGCLEPLLRTGRPFGLEVVGDPYEALGSIHHPAGAFLRHWFARQLRRQCRRACAVSYVSQSALQQRYAPGRGAFATHYSSIELPDEFFSKAPRTGTSVNGLFRIVSIGSMEQPYKGFDVLIDAIALCRREGLRLELVLVGDGRCRETLEQHAAATEAADYVIFRGALPAGQAVREELDRADLFVLASRTEGLPRAMIEAMARGLPCLGSRVGGIPELLPTEDLFSSGNTVELAGKIRQAVEEPGRLSRMSERNLARSREYRNSVLDARRHEFLTHVLQETQRWRAERSAA